VGAVPLGTPVDAHQTVDNNASANRCLELFINTMTSKIVSSLIRESPKQTPAKVVL
jgi:hypothetical protein